MNIINKDILTVTHGIICHQVNCQGVMGTGIALSIKKKYPIVYKKYRQECNEAANSSLLLGYTQFIVVNEDADLLVYNLFAQNFYGRDKRYTDYDALKKCLRLIMNTFDYKIFPIYFPYKMGCNNAGGDWGIVSKLIDEYIPEAIICKKGDR